ncbi:hypothetical protein WJX74_005118 [Apatococcus lobatus]|uniref:C2 domain-containing protein n=1 Tax=Apatococcus lobatus TaxID=904363 RepID=A0AAW1R1V2_9CHLO
MEPEKKGYECPVRGFVNSFRQQDRLKSKDSSKLVSLTFDEISVTFKEGSGLIGTKLAPYVCLRVGSEKPTSQNTSNRKQEIGSEVVWDQVLTFPNVKEGTSHLEVQLHEYHTLHPNKLVGTGSDNFVTTEDLNFTLLRLTDIHQKHVGDIRFRANLKTFRTSSTDFPSLGEKSLLAGGDLKSTKRDLEAESADPLDMKRQIFLETNWKTQYASLACQLVLKAPVSVAVVSSHKDTAEVVRQLSGWADTAKVKLHPVPCQQSASLTQKGKEKKLSVKKFITDKELTGSKFDAWIYVMGAHVEPGSKDKEASHELKHDRALLKGLLKRQRLPLTIIHSLPALEPAACKKALQITKNSNATVFCVPSDGSSPQMMPGTPLNPLGCYLHPWASPQEAVKATVPCLHARVAMNMLVRREVDRQLRRHKSPKATTVLWVGVSHTGLGILVPLQPYIGIPLLIAESFTRMFYHVLHVCHTAGIIYNLEASPATRPMKGYFEAWATLKGAITKKELEGLKKNPKLTKTALKDAAKDGGKAGLEGAAEAIFVEIGVIITKKLASTGAKQVLEQASAGIASQVVGYVIPAIGALLTVAMLPHTYHKIHQMVTCMAYTYHENWAFTSSLPLPMVYEALTMNQPDLASHLHKAMQLEADDEDSSQDLITTQWETPPQYGAPLALNAPSAGSPLLERHMSLGAASIHGGTEAGGDSEVIDFDTLFCYKAQAVSEQQLENLELGENNSELMQEMQAQPTATMQAADGTQVATWPFSNAGSLGGQGMSFSEVIGEPPPPEDAFHPEAHIPWLLSSKDSLSSLGSGNPMQDQSQSSSMGGSFSSGTPGYPTSGQSSGRPSQDGGAPMYGGSSQAAKEGQSPFGNYAAMPQPKGWGPAAAGGSIYHWESASSIETASSMQSQGSRSLSAGLYGTALAPQPSPMSSQNLGPRNPSGSQNLGPRNPSGGFGPPPGVGSTNPSSMNTSFSGSDYSETNHFQATNFGLGGSTSPQSVQQGPFPGSASSMSGHSFNGLPAAAANRSSGSEYQAAQRRPELMHQSSSGSLPAPSAALFPTIAPPMAPPAAHFPKVDASGF